LTTWREGADYRAGVTAQSALGGGAVLELSHEIDYAMWLLGDVNDVVARTAQVSDLEMDCEDVAELSLTFSSGAVGAIHLDTIDWKPTRYCRVVGERGTAEWDMHEGTVLLTRAGGDTEVRFSERSDPNEMYVAELAAFLSAARGEAPPEVTGEDGFRTLAVCLAARRIGARPGETP
jgi:predicted dehydrogenase